MFKKYIIQYTYDSRYCLTVIDSDFNENIFVSDLLLYTTFDGIISLYESKNIKNIAKNIFLILSYQEKKLAVSKEKLIDIYSKNSFKFNDYYHDIRKYLLFS